MKILSVKSNILSLNVPIIEYPSNFKGSLNINTNSLMEREFQPWGSGNKSVLKDGYIRAESSGNGTSFGIMHSNIDRTIPFRRNTEYTLSFEVRGNISSLGYNYFMRVESGNTGIGDVMGVSSTWKRVVITNQLIDWNTEKGYILFGSRDVGAGKWFEIRNVKLSKDFSDTFYTPNPNDIGLTIPDGISVYTPTINQNYIFVPEITEGLESMEINLNSLRLKELEEAFDG